MIRLFNFFQRFLAKSRNRQQLMIFVVFLIFGVVIVSHARNVTGARTDADVISRYRAAEQALAEAQARTPELQQQNEQLQQQRQAVLDRQAAGDADQEALAALRRYQMLAGLSAVQGDGLVVTLNDKQGYDATRDSILSIVHESYVEHVITLLIDHGAAAVAVNDSRIVGPSFIDCIGPTILCNKTRLSPPYVISAIGPAKAMQKAIADDQKLRQISAPNIGIRLSAEPARALVLPAFDEADNFSQYLNLLEGKEHED